MIISQLAARLREKECELRADMTRNEGEARDARVAETQNGTAAAESKENLFQQTTSEWNIFTQFRDALQRIENGTFGKCVDCGRQSEDPRLDTVPWTPYCPDHQNQHDRDLAERAL